MFQTKVVEKIKTDFVFNTCFLRKSRLLCHNGTKKVEQDRIQVTMYRGACPLRAG